MFRKSVSLMALAALVIMVATLTGCGRNTLARVNSDSVTKTEFYTRLEAVPVQTQQGTQPAGQYVMQQILAEKLVKQLADKEGVAVTQEQLQQKLDFQKKMNGADFEKSLAQQGLTADQWKAEQRVNQSYVNVITKGVTIPEADVKKAYQQALNAPNSPFKRPEQVLISGIGSKDKAKIDKAYALLAQGQDFGSVAMKMSDIPGAAGNQGYLTWVAETDPRIPKTITSVAFSLETGKYSKPIAIQKDWIIIKANQRRPARVLGYNDVKDAISEQMKVQKGGADGAFVKKFQQFVKESNITMKLEQYKTLPEMMKSNADKQLDILAKRSAASGVSGGAKQ